jgi:hypothetical protein
MSNNMADLNTNQRTEHRADWDELDYARPVARAPRNLSANVMARLAALSEAEHAVSLMADMPKYAAPVVKFPIPQVAVYVPESAESHNRSWLGYVVLSAAAGLVMLFSWVLYPAVASWFFGVPADAAMQTRLDLVASVWRSFTSGLVSFIVSYGAFIPMMISLAVGLVIMTTLIFSNNVRRQMALE